MFLQKRCLMKMNVSSHLSILILLNQANHSGLKAKQVHCHNTCENTNKDTLLICADSHGSGLSWHRQNKNQNTYSAVGFVRPGGRTKDILDFINISNELKSKDDVLVIFCGTNDISKNEANEAITGITETIQKVSKAERHLHNRHGLHLNNRGKRWLAEQICTAVNHMYDGTTSPSQPQGDLVRTEGVPATAETTSPLTRPSIPVDERAAASPSTPLVSAKGVSVAAGILSPTFLHITTPATDSATPSGNGLLSSVQHPL
ncbi:hypothetical protein J6590_040475 [Homalodisca vitripennis]|nr:hypothetical protein J6590_040475 [Homalodisca vitripennis]